MVLGGSLVAQIDLKSNAKVVYKLFTDKMYLAPQLDPVNILDIELHSGEWGRLGCTIDWHFKLGEQVFAVRDVIDAIDENEKYVSYNIIKGTLLESFKEVHFITKVDSNKDGGSTVTQTIAYEKLNEHVPDPDQIMAFQIAFTKGIDNNYKAT